MHALLGRAGLWGQVGPLAVAERTHWRWLLPIPAWAAFLLALGLALVFLWFYVSEVSPVGRWGRGLLFTLRMLAVGALLTLAAGPACERVREEVTDSWLVALVDRSVSMSLMDRYADRSRAEAVAAALGEEVEAVEGLSRLDLVKRILGRTDGALLAKLAERNRVKLYAFGEGRRILPLGELSRGAKAKGPEVQAAAQALTSLEAKSPETALGDSLNRALNEMRGQRIAGIAVLSDGRSNAGVLPPTKVARALRARGIPIFSVGVGNPEEPRDIALLDLQSRDVVIAEDRLRVKVSVSAQGLEEEDSLCDLIVELDGREVAREAVDLEGHGVRQDVGLQISPQKPGEYTLSVRIEPKPGELIRDNNRLSKRLTVIDKRIRVLVIDDLPRWEYRFLRWSLIRDERMEAQTFQISADRGFRQDCSPGLEPLREIPKTREELFHYHVVILGDVDPDAPEMEGRLELLRAFVEEGGGGLMLIAGRRYMPAAYVDTPLAPLLPVEVDPDAPSGLALGETIRTPFHPVLTLDGRVHPITQLEETPERSLRTWEQLPGLFWSFQAKAVKPTAKVLAVREDVRTRKGKPQPVFCLQQSGAGLVMFAATDDVWRWRAGVGDRYTYRFWAQAVQHLSTGRLLKAKRFSITTDKAVYDLGDRVTLDAEVYDQSMQPSEEATRTVFLQGTGGEPERVVLRRPPNEKGHFRGTQVADRVGTYKVWIAPGQDQAAAPPPGGEELAVRIYQVQVPVLEKADPKMDERLLRRLGKISGGAYLPIARLSELPEKVEAQTEVNEVVQDAVLVLLRWEVLCALVAVLGLEWLLRKRWKMW